MTAHLPAAEFGPVVTANALSLRPNGAGVSTYIRELLHALPARWQQRVLAHVQSDAADQVPRGVHTAIWPVFSGARRALAGARLPTSTGVFHALDVDLPLCVPDQSVTTVHDLSVFDVPWAFGGIRVKAERLLLRHAARRADVIIADSHFTADRIRTRFGRDCVVIPLAPATSMAPATQAERTQVREHYGLPDDFVLFVGTVEPRKDVPLLAQACAHLDLPLVIAGGTFGPETKLAGRVHRLGFVPGQHLPPLYGAARVVAYPSVYEGFGLPPVEALACGAALVCSRVADLPELIGAGAAWFRSSDGDDLARVLRQTWYDDACRSDLRIAGAAAAQRLTWGAVAAATVAVYEQLA